MPTRKTTAKTQGPFGAYTHSKAEAILGRIAAEAIDGGNQLTVVQEPAN